MQCGAVSGLFAQTLTYPLEITRRRMQTIGVVATSGQAAAVDIVGKGSHKAEVQEAAIRALHPERPPTLTAIVTELYAEQGIRGFFSKLFKKKGKSTLDQDSTQNLKNEDADYGYDDFEGKPKDTTNTAPSTEQVKPSPKKKGLFRKKDKKEPAKKEVDQAKKEDEKDDGF